MSANQKQPAAGGPQTQRYSNSPYQPIISQHTNGSDAFHSNASYVTQNQGPNQGPGLRNIQPTRPPNQSSTPPTTDLNVTNLQPSISPMQYVPNPAVRPPPTATFFSNRGTGVPPAQNARMPSQQHRGQTPVFQSQYVMQPMYLPSNIYYAPNSRPPNNMMNPPSFTQPVFQPSFSSFPQFSSSVSSGVPAFTQLYPVYQPQGGPISLSRPSATPVTAAPPNPPAGSIANAPILAPPPAPPTNYSRNSRQRRSKAIPIIDPNTGQDKLDEIFETKNASHPASGESSARQTPQPPNNNKEIQAAFAKQVAQAINEDKRFPDNPDQPPASLYESSGVVDQFPAVPPPNQPPIANQPPRFDVQNSTLQCDAKEFVLSTSKEATPIVSANSDAVEVILAKKDGDSPTKSRKQSHRDSKPEILKDLPQPKETECDTSSSIVKEETTPVPQQVIVDSAQPAAPVVVKPSQPAIKETVPDKKGAKKPVVNVVPNAEPDSTVLPPENASQNAGKSKNKHNRNNVHNQNGKAQVAPPQQQQQQQQQQPVPVPQPPKPNNRSNKSKELNMKGANKEGTDMDAFNDNANPKREINANAVAPPDELATNHKVVADAVNANVIAPAPQPVLPPSPPPPQPQQPVVPKKPLETEPIVCPIKDKVDANENVTATNNITAAAIVAPPVAAVAAAPKPVAKLFDVTSIVKDSPMKMMPPFPVHDNNRDETDRAETRLTGDATATLPSKGDGKEKEPRAIVYRPGQWAPDCPDGKKVYDRDFLMRLKDFPASLQKPDNIPDAILSDERNRQIDGRLSMGGRTDFSTPSYNSYGGKSGSQRGTLPKRNSQSNKMGSRGGDKIVNKHQPKVTISLSRDEVKLHESENAWKPARFNKGENASAEEKKTETLYKKVRSVLNKLTPQKFDTLVNQVRQLQIDTKERLQGVIDLVFEKAIDEPNFSVAYAMMCKEIQNMQVSVTSAGGEDSKKLAFRTLLITRCQMEFEKQSVDETTRNSKVKEIEECTDAEKKKELQFELEESDRRVRMKSVGCIRFIGELFKQQMLTASIMRRCLQTLLEHKDEESLECLCKLLTTVGKELESKNIDLVSIFDEMKRITEAKRQKVSSRIRFMLKDVIDLRDSRWIPRRSDLNPKTIDQIQKEAENEHLNIQVQNMNEPHRKDERSNGPRGGGGGGGGGGNRQRMSEDGWNSVSSRNNRQQVFAFDACKVKGGVNLPQADEPFGGPHLFGRWTKGSAGIKNPQTQTSIGHNTNFFATLENYDPEKRPNSNQRNKDPYSSKGPSMERNYNKSYDGRGSRSGSQHRDSVTPMRTTGPPPASVPSAPKAPVVQLPPPVAASIFEPKLTDEQLERRIHNSLDEYVNGCITTAEYVQDVATLVPYQTDYPRIVFESYNFILEKSQTVRLKTGELFAKLVKAGHVTVVDYLKGVAELLGSWEDLVIDIPQVWQYFAEDIVPLLLEEALPLTALHRQLDNLGIVRNNQAKRLLKPLFLYIVKEKGPNFLKAIWQQSSLQFQDFMPSAEIELFVKENNLDFLLGGDIAVGEGLLLSYDEIQQKLSRFLRERAPFDDIVSWISANVGGRVKENEFIRTLATAIFENSISKNKLQPDVLSSNTKLIQKYVDANLHYELQCLYALQALVRKLEYPQGLLLSICNKLYEDSTFSQESFIAWQESQDPAEKEGKGVAFIQLTSFFTQLRENEEDDESSSNAEDA